MKYYELLNKIIDDLTIDVEVADYGHYYKVKMIDPENLREAVEGKVLVEASDLAWYHCHSAPLTPNLYSKDAKMLFNLEEWNKEHSELEKKYEGALDG